MAGIAAAIKDNGLGMAGVAPDAELVVAKAFNGAGAPTTDDIIAGIKWVVDHGAKVVNLSLGDAELRHHRHLRQRAARRASSTPGPRRRPRRRLRQRRPVRRSASAAPSTATSTPSSSAPPAPTTRSAEYSSPTGNAKWALVAPGGAGDGSPRPTTSARPSGKKGKQNQYGYLAGTSMAAPHVAGAVALLLAQGLDQQQAVERMLATADPVPCGRQQRQLPGPAQRGPGHRRHRLRPSPPDAPRRKPGAGRAAS